MVKVFWLGKDCLSEKEKDSLEQEIAAKVEICQLTELAKDQLYDEFLNADYFAFRNGELTLGLVSLVEKLKKPIAFYMINNGWEFVGWHIRR